MAIVLDILRHAQAGPTGPGGDRERSLTPAGERVLAGLAAQLARGPRPDRVFASPYARAQQTARIVAGMADPPLEVETLAALEPDREPAQVLDALAAAGVTAGHVLVVGHQPLLGRLAAHVAGAEPHLSPATLVRVECPGGLAEGAGRIVLSLPPENPAHA